MYQFTLPQTPLSALGINIINPAFFGIAFLWDWNEH